MSALAREWRGHSETEAHAVERRHGSAELESGTHEVADDPRSGRILAAMAPGVMSIVFQPVVDLRRGVVAGAEALARFAMEPVRTPDLWFQEAWDVDLGIDLEVIAIERALALLDRLPNEAHLAINASPQTLVSPLLDSVLARAPGRRLIIELTEHAEVHDYERVKAAIDRMRARGIRLAIDDAGAGVSSLQHILQLRPDLIKLDRSLTRDIDADPVRYSLAAALVTFAVSLDAHICAEGIERPEELAALQHLGIAYGQGYFLGRPHPLPLAAPPKGVWLSEQPPAILRERSGFRSLRAPAAPPGLGESVPPLPTALCPSPMVRDADRLAATRETELLDTPAEEAFDRVTRWAGTLLRAPIALFTLIDQDRLFFKSAVGLPEAFATTRQSPLSHSLCQHVVTTDGPLAISNLVDHPLSRDSRVMASFGAGAYAAVPVRTAGSQPIGTLCVMDMHPRAWSDDDKRVLGELAASIVTELEVRAMRRHLRDGLRLARPEADR